MATFSFRETASNRLNSIGSSVYFQPDSLQEEPAVALGNCKRLLWQPPSCSGLGAWPGRLGVALPGGQRRSCERRERRDRRGWERGAEAGWPFLRPLGRRLLGVRSPATAPRPQRAEVPHRRHHDRRLLCPGTPGRLARGRSGRGPGAGRAAGRGEPCAAHDRLQLDAGDGGRVDAEIVSVPTRPARRFVFAVPAVLTRARPGPRSPCLPAPAVAGRGLRNEHAHIACPSLSGCG